jgi:hypothetical protein
MPSTAHIQDEELHQYASEALQQDRGSYIRSHILECTGCRDRLTAEVVTRLSTIGKNPSQSSREHRVAAAGFAMLQPICPLSLEPTTVEILNKSKKGYGLRTKIFLLPGTIVDLLIGTTPAIATVRYCRALGDSIYQTGVQTERQSLAASAHRGPTVARDEAV